MKNNPNDPLRDLARSSLEFLQRFNAAQQSPERVTAHLGVFREEVGEFIEAAQEGTNKDHIAEEAADVFVTVINACHAAGVDIEQLVKQVYAVAAKNDAKTHETHIDLNGKIRRREPRQE